MRKAYQYRQRQQQFNNSFSINQIYLPKYDALHDPYLAGFFEKPFLKRHLKQMHLIKSTKRKSHSSGKRPATSSGINNLTQINYKKLRLPNIQNIIEDVQKNFQYQKPRTASTSHRKRVVAKSMQRKTNNSKFDNNEF